MRRRYCSAVRALRTPPAVGGGAGALAGQRVYLRPTPPPPSAATCPPCAPRGWGGRRDGGARPAAEGGPYPVPSVLCSRVCTRVGGWAVTHAGGGSVVPLATHTQWPPPFGHTAAEGGASIGEVGCGAAPPCACSPRLPVLERLAVDGGARAAGGRRGRTRGRRHPPSQRPTPLAPFPPAPYPSLARHPPAERGMRAPRRWRRPSYLPLRRRGRGAAWGRVVTTAWTGGEGVLTAWRLGGCGLAGGGADEWEALGGEGRAAAWAGRRFVAASRRRGARGLERSFAGGTRELTGGRWRADAFSWRGPRRAPPCARVPGCVDGVGGATARGKRCPPTRCPRRAAKRGATAPPRRAAAPPRREAGGVWRSQGGGGGWGNPALSPRPGPIPPPPPRRGGV